MKYKKMQNSGLEISSLAVGTWALGFERYGEVTFDDAVAAIRKAVELGVNIIDTAPCYGWGTSEKVVGAAIEGLDRSKLIISTKGGLVNSPRDKFQVGGGRDSSFKNLVREVEASLYNLKTDYIDIYHIHWPDPKTTFAETMTALNFLKEQGKIRHIAVSNFSIEQIQECQKYAQIDFQQPQFSMVAQQNRELMEWGYSQGIDSLTYGSLGSGILTGYIRELPNFAKDDIRVTFYDFFKEPKFSKVMKLLDVMDVVAANHNATCAQVAINWSATKDYVGTELVGMTNAAQAEENAKAFDFTLTDSEIAMLEDACAKLDL